MKQAVVISISNPVFLERTLKSFLESTIFPDLMVFVLDRCDTDVITSTLGTTINHVVLPTQFRDSVFAAGRPRDLGIDYIQTNHPDIKHIVFLDGDCSASPQLFAEHRRIHARVGSYPLLVNSMRVDIQPDGSRVCDTRITNPCIFSPGKDVVTVFDKHLYVDNNLYPACVGCNISLNIKAIELTRRINSVVLGNPRTFAHVFDGQWGGEDPYLSATLFRSNAMIVNANPDASYVLHNWHDSKHRTPAHVRILKHALSKFNAYSRTGKLLLPSTRIECTDTSSPDTCIATATDMLYPQITSLASRVLYGLCRNEADKWLSVLACSRVFTYETTTTAKQTRQSSRAYRIFNAEIHDICFQLSDFDLTDGYDGIYVADTTQTRYHNTYGMFR